MRAAHEQPGARVAVRRLRIQGPAPSAGSGGPAPHDRPIRLPALRPGKTRNP